MVALGRAPAVLGGTYLSKAISHLQRIMLRIDNNLSRVKQIFLKYVI
jgi:hypothetical protein